MKNLLLLLATSLSLMANAQETHPITKQLKACLSNPSNQTTAGMLSCIQDANDAWDKEMNEAYNKLMAVLSDEEKTQLRDAQRNWIAYRDSELKFSSTMHGNMEGTMRRLSAASRAMEITATRAKELKAYLDTISMEGF